MTSADDAAASPPHSSTQDAPNKTPEIPAESLNSQRVFKKSSPNNKLTLYLSSRDLIVSPGTIDRLQGVVLLDPDFVEGRKVYGQVTLTFRYGREDEEVMGLKFCNEAIMCLTQLYPPSNQSQEPQPPNTPLQEALVKRLGANAFPFHMEITPLAPPSVQLVPAKEYSGAPIGTSYDIRAYVAEKSDEKQARRTTVRMGIRVVQLACAPPSPLEYIPGGSGKTGKDRAKLNRKVLLYGCQSAPLNVQLQKSSITSRSIEGTSSGLISPERMDVFQQEVGEVLPPRATVEKPFLLSDGKIVLSASLNKAIFAHGEVVFVHVHVQNNSNKTVKRMKVFVVQHVDVCMFSNGKFKNVVDMVNAKQDCPIYGGACLDRTYTLLPMKSSTKNWIALEDSYNRTDVSLASTVTSLANNPDDRNVFAIYVSYYVKVKLLVSLMGGEVCLKLPFTLMHTSAEGGVSVGEAPPVPPAPPDDIT